MSREREIEKLQTELKYYENYLMQCLLYPKSHQGEAERMAIIVANILYQLRTIYNIIM